MATAVEPSARRKSQLWADSYPAIKTEKRSQLGMLAGGYLLTVGKVAKFMARLSGIPILFSYEIRIPESKLEGR
jgi:hypothetical protein